VVSMVDYFNLTPEQREVLKKENGLTDEQLDSEIAKLNEADDVRDNIPSPMNKDDILKFLRDVFSIGVDEFLKMNRTGNLSPEELGHLRLPIRGYNDVAMYNLSEDKDLVAAYLFGKSANVITTSTSKKGFFLQLITTTKKISKNIGSKSVSRQSSVFGGTKETVVGGDEE
jgi:hypothetical protein